MADNVSRYKQDPALRTSDGRVLRLPHAFDATEAALAGNSRELRGGVVAVYDGASETGAVWIPATCRWVMQQPITRAEFDAALAEGERIARSPGDGMH